MVRRRTVAAVGTVVTVFLLTAVAIIEAVNNTFTGLIGVPVGGIVAFVALTAVFAGYAGLGRWLRTVVDAAAGFGVLVGYPAIVVVTDPVPDLPVRQMLTVAAIVGCVFAAVVSVATASPSSTVV